MMSTLTLCFKIPGTLSGILYHETCSDRYGAGHEVWQDRSTELMRRKLEPST